MGAMDKAKDKLEAAEGRVKDAAGAATGNRSMEAEGKAKEVTGNLKQAGDKVKDAFSPD